MIEIFFVDQSYIVVEGDKWILDNESDSLIVEDNGKITALVRWSEVMYANRKEKEVAEEEPKEGL